MTDIVELTLKWQGTEFPVPAGPATTVADVKRAADARTTVPAGRVKLLGLRLATGKPAADEDLVVDCVLKPGAKIMVLGCVGWVLRLAHAMEPVPCHTPAPPTTRLPRPPPSTPAAAVAALDAAAAAAPPVADDWDLPDGDDAEVAVPDREENQAGVGGLGGQEGGWGRPPRGWVPGGRRAPPARATLRDPNPTPTPPERAGKAGPPHRQLRLEAPVPAQARQEVPRDRHRLHHF